MRKMILFEVQIPAVAGNIKLVDDTYVDAKIVVGLTTPEGDGRVVREEISKMKNRDRLYLVIMKNKAGD